MRIITRRTVRVLLLNTCNELLLMCVEDFDISTLDGKRNKRFWCTIGGAIDCNETVEQTALREIFEETEIEESAIKLAPVVWHSKADVIFKGKPTHLDELFIVAKKHIKDVFLCKPTQDEQAAVKKLQWFSLEDIKQSSEIIFPVNLAKLLPDVLLGYYPKKPVAIHTKK